MLQRKLNIPATPGGAPHGGPGECGVVGPDLGAGRGAKRVLAKRKEEDGDESDDYDE